METQYTGSTMVKNNGGMPRPRMASESTPPLESETEEQLTLANVYERMRAAVAATPEYPHTFSGQGVVTCGGGRYFTAAYVTLSVLRQHGCNLPVEVWYLGSREMSQEMIGLMEELGNVRCIDAYKVREIHPMRHLNGWELKSYAVLYSSFKEVLFVDADNIPTVEPSYLFRNHQYQAHGAVFWPDIYRKPGEYSFQVAIFEALGIPLPYGQPEFESAQMLIDKEKSWAALYLAVWINAYSDFFYTFVYGDKETFNLAWRFLRAPFAMPSHRIHHLRDTLCQHGFDGELVFQHRFGAKFELSGNVPVGGFKLESDCLIHIANLRERWDGRIHPVPKLDFLEHVPDAIKAAVADLTSRPLTYTRLGFDTRLIRLMVNGTVGKGAALYEQYWSVRLSKESVYLTISSAVKPTCTLLLGKDGVWRGRWEHSGEMDVEIR